MHMYYVQYTVQNIYIYMRAHTACAYIYTSDIIMYIYIYIYMFSDIHRHVIFILQYSRTCLQASKESEASRQALLKEKERIEKEMFTVAENARR
jgi:hypothetical protein